MRSPYLGLLFAALLGCSATGGSNLFGSGGGGGTPGSGGAGGSAPSSSGTGGDIDISDAGGQDGSDPPLIAEVFAHSASTLYKLDPITKVVTTVGFFSGCDGVIDIALDKDGVMFGTTFGGLFKIDKATAVCTFIQSGGYPNSLSFVPKGTLDPDEEALVGYVGGQYVRIDKNTGSVTNVGQLGGGYSSSGDIVSAIGGGTYLTVNGNGCGDCIVEVDPKTGALVKMIGALGHGSVFGLAFWGGVAYGFDDYGELFQIDLMTAGTVVIPTGVGGLSFYGAGSTTAAPLKPPT